MIIPNITEEIIVKKLTNSEQIIRQTYKLRPFPLQRGYKVIRGEYPVLLSAPHAARTIREGKIKLRENYVGSFVQNLSKICKVYGIYTTNIIHDPNYNNSSKYKTKIKQLIEKGFIKIVIDIHGLNQSRRYDVDIGTYNNQSILENTEIVNILKTCFNRYGFQEISENIFTSTKKDTITNFSYKNGIPAVQLEIHKSCRNISIQKYRTICMFKAIYEAVETIKADFAEED
jgi:hypothetical protein